MDKITMNKLFYTYTLVDPRTNEVKYVGATSDPEKRLYAHIKDNKGRPSKKEWIKDLSLSGLTPLMELCGTFKDSESAMLDEQKLYLEYVGKCNLVCDNPIIRPYMPNVETINKVSMKIEISKEIQLLLKKLAEKENRSQGQQIEKMITDECKKQKLK